MIVTVAATGADTTRPLGWGAVTVTYRGGRVVVGGREMVGNMGGRAGWFSIEWAFPRPG